MKLRSLKGIIHVGANTGQERAEYAKHNLNVLWIEPLPNYFRKLQRNIRHYPKQRALNYLVGDVDDKPVRFHVCDNEGLSSSMMDFARHPEFYPQVHFTGDIDCRMWTLDTIVARENIDLHLYDGMLIDVQGAELLVLKGAKNTLAKMKTVQVESADFELYKDYPTTEQLAAELATHGLNEIGRNVFNDFQTAHCFDVTYARA